MSKNHTHPGAGGGYSQDAATGKRTQTDGTLPALTQQEINDGWTDGPDGRKPPAKPIADAPAAPEKTKR